MTTHSPLFGYRKSPPIFKSITNPMEKEKKVGDWFLNQETVRNQKKVVFFLKIAAWGEG